MISAGDAERLQNDPDLNEVFDLLRADALEALAIAEPDDMKQIIRLQAKVAVIEEFQTDLEGMVLRAQEQEEENAAPA